MSRYQEASYVPLATFQEDADLTTTTAPVGSIAGENLSVWHEGHIPWRAGNRGYNGVFLGWNRAKGAAAATYTLTLPDGAAAKWRLGEGSTIELSVAAMDEDASLPRKKTEEEKKKEEEEKKGGHVKEERTRVAGFHGGTDHERRGNCRCAGEQVSGHSATLQGEIPQTQDHR